MSDATTTRTPSRQFNHLLGDLLEDPNTDGVFIGELHTRPALRQTLVYLMPQIRNRVSTLSIELPQRHIDAMINAGSAQAWLASPLAGHIPENYRSEEFYALVTAAHRAGIRVLGHEENNPNEAFNNHMQAFLQRHFPDEIRQIEARLREIPDAAARETQQRQLTQNLVRRIFDGDPTLSAEANRMRRSEAVRIINEHHPAHDGGIRRRNAYAADYIRRHRAPGGRVLVLGGAAHSRQQGPLLYPNSPSTLRDGLDQRLNLSAINLTVFPAGRVGDTHSVSGIPGDGTPGVPGGRTHEVHLPHDLRQFVREHHITQWPPQNGIPTIPLPSIPPPPRLNTPATPALRPRSP